MNEFSKGLAGITTKVGYLNGQLFGCYVKLKVCKFSIQVLDCNLIWKEHRLLERRHHKIVPLILNIAVPQFLYECILLFNIVRVENIKYRVYMCNL